VANEAPVKHSEILEREEGLLNFITLVLSFVMTYAHDNLTSRRMTCHTLYDLHSACSAKLSQSVFRGLQSKTTHDMTEGPNAIAKLPFDSTYCLFI